MKNLRFLLSIAVVVVLAVGYGLSQFAAMNGTAAEYAVKIDCPAVQWVALCFLIVCIVFSFIRENEADEK